MTDNIQHIDVDSDEFLSAPKALRDHVKALQNANTRLAETNTDLSGRLTATALNDVLTGFKNPERVKRDLLSDKVDPLDPEAVKTWLGSNGDDYARGEGSSAPTGTPGVTPEEVEAQQRFASGGALKDVSDMTRLESANAEITPDMDGAAVAALYAKHGL